MLIISLCMECNDRLSLPLLLAHNKDSLNSDSSLLCLLCSSVFSVNRRDGGESAGGVRVEFDLFSSVVLSDPKKLALRAGNEKEEGETADTVGCCSLRVEHITLHPQLDGSECVVEFDFLGKDSIRYYNKVPVISKVKEQKNRTKTLPYTHSFLPHCIFSGLEMIRVNTRQICPFSEKFDFGRET